MSFKLLLQTYALACALGAGSLAAAAPSLVLEGYTDEAGVISVLHGGNSSDPYFAMQALLLAHDNGMDTSAAASKFADWLVTRQKPDGTFDRFCRDAAKKWTSCKAADADDSLLALWIRLLETMPDKLGKSLVLTKSHAISRASLDHLFQPSRGIYMVSPLVLHGLFMDNLEVWALKAQHKGQAQRAEAGKLAQAIHDTFWIPVDRRFMVSTQMEQRAQASAFYPNHVAQIFPLLVDFPLLPAKAGPYYRSWMKTHRAEWLTQGKADYPWGLLAVLALRQNDTASARCWLREAGPLRHSPRWAVTDEASFQILTSKGLTAADKDAGCG